jgi:hypothetical protein
MLEFSIEEAINVGYIAIYRAEKKEKPDPTRWHDPVILFFSNNGFKI